MWKQRGQDQMQHPYKFKLILKFKKHKQHSDHKVKPNLSKLMTLNNPFLISIIQIKHCKMHLLLKIKSTKIILAKIKCTQWMISQKPTYFKDQKTINRLTKSIIYLRKQISKAQKVWKNNYHKEIHPKMKLE